MTLQFYKSLDKEMEILGVRGRWIKIIIISAVCAVIFGIIVGSLTSMAVGFISVLVIIVCCVFAVIFIQPRLPSRRIAKTKIASRTSGVVFRRETLCRILLEDPRYQRVKESLEAARKEMKAAAKQGN